MFEAFGNGPEFSGPACGDWAGRNDAETIVGASGSDGSIGAVVIDQKDMEWAGIILIRKRCDGQSDDGFLVSCRHNRGNG